jgi:inosine/guanosine/xanthosine phosphorylase family protein
MSDTEQHAFEAVAQECRNRFGEPPQTAIILGSGVGTLRDQLTESESASYGDLGLPETTVSGHSGDVIVGKLGGGRVAMLSGRIHSYEGGSLEEAVRGVRAMAAWGVEKLVMTSAVGSLLHELKPGDLLRVTDHINLMGINPLVGPNIASLGPRFPDMSAAYDPGLGAEADAVAEELGIELHRGVYAAVRGPCFETPAEVRMLALVGAAVVGMSVVPETIAAVHAGMKVLTIAVVSNEGTGLSDTPPNHAAVTATVQAATKRLCPIIQTLVSKW